MTTVAIQMSPPKEIQPENYISATEQPPVNQPSYELVPFPSCSNTRPIDIQESEKHMKTI